MERTRFSFRRKGSGKGNKPADKEPDGNSAFDYDSLSYIRYRTGL